MPAPLRGSRVGLITNHTGIDRARTPDIDLIARHPDLTLVALLAPEHGIGGDPQDGVKIEDEIDTTTGVPIYSLYLAEDRGPTPAMLKDVDRAGVRPPGGRRPHVDVCFDDGAVDAGGGEERDPVRRAGSAEPDEQVNTVADRRMLQTKSLSGLEAKPRDWREDEGQV